MNVTLSTVHYHSKGNPCFGLPGWWVRDGQVYEEGKGDYMGFVMGNVVYSVAHLLL